MALRVGNHDPLGPLEPGALYEEANDSIQIVGLTYLLVAAEIFVKTAESSACQMRGQDFSATFPFNVENPLEVRLMTACCVAMTGTIFMKAMRLLSVKRTREGRPYIAEYRSITWMMLFSASIMRDCLLR